MIQSIAEFIAFVEEQHPADVPRQAVEYKKLLVKIAEGNLAFPDEFLAWRGSQVEGVKVEEVVVVADTPVPLPTAWSLCE